MTEQDIARQRAKRWLIGAGGVAAVSFVIAVAWPPIYVAFRIFFLAGLVWCLATWSGELGFVRGWDASRRNE